MKLKFFFRENIRNNWGLYIVLLLSFVPLVDLLHPGLPLTHDGKDHVARIANFYLSLSEGDIIPRWAANLNWGYGHPVMMFLYPLPSYISSFFHLLSFSFIDSVKLVFAFAFIGSGITMYLWIRNFLGEYPAVVASVLYMYAPYRFVDLYVRGALGEHVAFVFMPLVFYFLLKLKKSFEKNAKGTHGLYLIGIAFSFAALLLSHNAISIMFLPILGGYALYLLLMNKDRKFALFACIALLAGILLSGFFLFPAFFEGKYTLRDIVTGNEYISRFVNPMSLFYSTWNFGITGQFSVQIGLAHIFFILLFPYILYQFIKKKDTTFYLYIFFVFAFFVSLFLTIKESNPIYLLVTTLQKFQFPWRFLTITVFTSSALAAFAFSTIKKEKFKRVLLIIFIAAILFFNKDYWHVKSYYYNSDSFFNSIYDGTTDTGESSPIWSIRFMEHRPKAKFELIGGSANIREVKRNSTIHHYLVDAGTNLAQIKDNTVYFPGWKVYVNGSQVPIQFQDRHNLGLITFNVSQGKNDVIVTFTDTKLRTLSNIISLLTLLVLLVLGGFLYKTQKNKS